MSNVSVSAELVAAYWRHHQLVFSADPNDQAGADDWLWAWEEVDQAALDASPGVVELLVALAKAAPNDQALGYLGVGPLQDLVRRHGAKFVHAIDEAAHASQSFQFALGCVWYGTDVD
jgi:hypothetical protein